MSDKLKYAAAMFFCIPFLVSAAFWISAWVGYPVAVIGSVIWLGACVHISEEVKS